MKEFLKITGSAFIGCFLAIWAFGKCKDKTCKKSENFKKVAEKVKNMQVQTKKEEIQKENPTFVDVETEEPQKQAVKKEKLVSTAMEVAQAIY